MNIFIDTSSLVKLYHKEAGTEDLDNIFYANKIQSIFHSTLSKIDLFGELL